MSQPAEPAVPPEAQRNAIIKTAAFVAANGQVFEQRLRVSEATNLKFAFLQPDHEFHAFFRAQVAAKATATDAGPAAASTPAAAKAPPANAPAEAAAPAPAPLPQAPTAAAPPAAPPAAPAAPATPAAPAGEAPAASPEPPGAAAPAAADELPELATPEALRAFMGTGALLAAVDDFLADEILADEVLELIEEELGSINGKPLSQPARDAFWLRRLLYTVAPALVFKHGDAVEKRFGSSVGVLAVPPAALAVELSNVGVATTYVPPLLRALAPLRATAARAAHAAAVAAKLAGVSLSHNAAVAAAATPEAATPPAADAAPSPAPSPAGSSMASSAASSAAPSPPSSSPPESAAAAPSPSIAVTAPDAPPAVVPLEAPVEPASPVSRSSASPTYNHSRLTGQELEEKKKQFRLEQMARREANLAKREAAHLADSGAYMRQQREMQEVFATGDVDLFAAKFLRPTAAAQPEPQQPKAAPEPARPTLAALAQSVAPTQCDEQRVLLALVEELAAERAAAKEREAAEKAMRIKETLVSVLPPRRTQESEEAEAARQYDLARQQESSCTLQ